MGLHTTTDIILNEGLTNHTRKAAFLSEEDNGSITLDIPVHSISISNVGAAIATIITKGNTANLPIGSTISFDAGGNDNTFPEGTFAWDSTGTTLLIAYTSNI